MGERLLKADCRLEGGQDLQFYAGLVEFLDEIEGPRLTNTYSFCPLPSSTCHVTVWDGLNDGNVKDVPVGYRSKLENFLRDLPDSLLTDNDFTREVYCSPLNTQTGWSVTFRFHTLINWANRALVVLLAPIDQDSERELERIVDGREALYARFREQFEVDLRWDYYPHVTLGYFANEEYGALVMPQVALWTESLRNRVGHLTVTFSNISLYGFTDMVTFFRGA
jgi:hypothetical protein